MSSNRESSLDIKWDKLKEEMGKILVDMSDIGFAIEFSKIWNQIEAEGDKLKEKADKYDFYALQLVELEKVGVWGAINKLQEKIDTVHEITDEFVKHYQDGDDRWASAIIAQIRTVINT